MQHLRTKSNSAEQDAASERDKCLARHVLSFYFHNTFLEIRIWPGSDRANLVLEDAIGVSLQLVRRNSSPLLLRYELNCQTQSLAGPESHCPTVQDSDYRTQTGRHCAAPGSVQCSTEYTDSALDCPCPLGVKSDDILGVGLTPIINCVDHAFTQAIPEAVRSSAHGVIPFWWSTQRLCCFAQF